MMITNSWLKIKFVRQCLQLGALGSACERLGIWECVTVPGSAWEPLGISRGAREHLECLAGPGAHGSAWEHFGAPGNTSERLGTLRSA